MCRHCRRDRLATNYDLNAPLHRSTSYNSDRLRNCEVVYGKSRQSQTATVSFVGRYDHSLRRPYTVQQGRRWFDNGLIDGMIRLVLQTLGNV